MSLVCLNLIAVILMTWVNVTLSYIRNMYAYDYTIIMFLILFLQVLLWKLIGIQEDH